MRQGSRPAVPDDAAVVENFLKLSSGGIALSGCQIRFSAYIHRIEAGSIVEERNFAQLDRGSNWQGIQGRAGLPRPSADCALMAGSQSDCIWVSSGKRFPKSCAMDSARETIPGLFQR
jgi:hypothetical protein